MINIRENRKINQEWTIQRNRQYWEQDTEREQTKQKTQQKLKRCAIWKTPSPKQNIMFAAILILKQYIRHNIHTKIVKWVLEVSTIDI